MFSYWAERRAVSVAELAKVQLSRTSLKRPGSVGCYQTSDATGMVKPVTSEGDPQGSLDVSRTIGKARSVPKVCVGIDPRVTSLRRRRTATHCRVKAGEAMPVEDVEELHPEVGVDSFGEHGDGLGNVEVLAVVEEFAYAEGTGRVAKREIRRGRKRCWVDSEAFPIDEVTAAVDTTGIHPRNDIGTAAGTGCSLASGEDA